jgi:hypothetical protein
MSDTPPMKTFDLFMSRPLCCGRCFLLLLLTAATGSGLPAF